LKTVGNVRLSDKSRKCLTQVTKDQDQSPFIPGKIKMAATWSIKFTNDVKPSKALKHKPDDVCGKGLRGEMKPIVSTRLYNWKTVASV
jgi:hypothetical protein